MSQLKASHQQNSAETYKAQSKTTNMHFKVIFFLHVLLLFPGSLKQNKTKQQNRTFEDN